MEKDATNRVAIIILGAGAGERLGAGKPKALAQVLGITLLELSFSRMSKVADQIIVTFPEGYEDEFRKDDGQGDIIA